MKLLFVCVTLVVFLCADEMQRIEAIVNDITKLRSDYNECKTQLKSNKTTIKEVKKIDCSKYKKELKKYKNTTKKYRKLLKKEKQKNSALKKKMSSMSDLSMELDKSLDGVKAQDIKYLHREINKYRILLRIRDDKIKDLKNKLGSCSQSSAVDSSKKSPKLATKNELQNKNGVKEFKSRPFRLKANSKIFNVPDGKIITEWEKDASFTSNKKLNNWVKITGYFVNKKWKRSKKEMWVQEEKTFKR